MRWIILLKNLNMRPQRNASGLDRVLLVLLVLLVLMRNGLEAPFYGYASRRHYATV